MSLRIRRGTEAQRTTLTFDLGEVVYTTDTKKLYIGDGVTVGGTNVLANMAGTGVTFNSTTQQLDFSASGITTNNIAEGSNNKYFTNVRAQDAFGALLTNGTQTGLSITYDSVNHALNIAVSDIASVSQDSNPTLGGNLGLAAHNITGTGNINITGSITATTLSAGTGLGASLNLNTYSILGTGSINITTGNISTASGTVSASGNISTSAGNLVATAGNVTASGYVSSSAFQATATANTVVFKSSNIYPSDSYLITDGTSGGNPTIRMLASKGTLAAPTNLSPGDVVGSLGFFGYYNGTWQESAGLSFNFDATANFAAGNFASNFQVGTNNSSGGFNGLKFDYQGTLTVPNFLATGLTLRSVNYITVATSTTYALSTTKSYNILLVTAGSLTATLTFPTSGLVDGQIIQFVVSGNTVTLALTAGPTLNVAFAGSATAGTIFTYIYRASGTTWYKV
jgi:hypothetical protein